MYPEYDNDGLYPTGKSYLFINISLLYLISTNNENDFSLSHFFILPVGNLCRSKKIKVSCIGNSVTYGYLLPEREVNAYPAQLQRLLGEKYAVANFGKSGATLLRKGHRPYTEQEEYRQALEYAGDMVVIHLGLNDTDPVTGPITGTILYGLHRFDRSFESQPPL